MPQVELANKLLDPIIDFIDAPVADQPIAVLAQQVSVSADSLDEEAAAMGLPKRKPLNRHALLSVPRETYDSFGMSYRYKASGGLMLIVTGDDGRDSLLHTDVLARETGELKDVATASHAYPGHAALFVVGNLASAMKHIYFEHMGVPFADKRDIGDTLFIALNAHFDAHGLSRSRHQPVRPVGFSELSTMRALAAMRR